MTGREPGDGRSVGLDPPAGTRDERRPAEAGLRDAVLDLEEPLADLRSALAALDLIASGGAGIERDDMVGLRYVAKQARELADATHRRWRRVLDRLGGGPEPG